MRVRQNKKRKMITEIPNSDIRDDLAKQVHYTGSPYHKQNPVDYNLTPPSQPRPDKTLCDSAGIITRNEAQDLLCQGVKKGLFSEPQDGQSFPKHIWSVKMDANGNPIVFEAKYNNSGPGDYHGYPLPDADPFREVVLQRWRVE